MQEDRMNCVVIVHGNLKQADERQSRATHDATVAMIGAKGRAMGNIGHRAYLNPRNRREFLAIDTWDNLEGPQKLLQDPNLAAEFGKLFDGRPEVTILEESGWTAW
jgi:hypothetical protein